MGCDLHFKVYNEIIERFQSTQPEWAATIDELSENVKAFISIHAARVGCDLEEVLVFVRKIYFNPRSPSGLRPVPPVLQGCDFIFQSTQPEWAATIYVRVHIDGTWDFNPRSPSGLRPSLFRIILVFLLFQSTQPEWAATLTYQRGLWRE